MDAPLADVAWPRYQRYGEELRSRGRHAVLTGAGGDDLVWDPNYSVDLWRTGQQLGALGYCLFDLRVRRDGSQVSAFWYLISTLFPGLADGAQKLQEILAWKAASRRSG